MIGLVGDLSRQLGRALGQLSNPGLCSVGREPVSVTSERVRQDDVGAGIHKAAVQVLHLLRVVHVPQLRRVIRPEPHPEVVRGGRAVGE